MTALPKLLKRSWLSLTSASRSTLPRGTARLGIETLEDRNCPSTIGSFDSASATWYLRDSNGPGAPDIAPFQYGAPGWVGVVGDWNGDGVETIGVFDPSTATWYLRDSNGPGAPDVVFQYGLPGWVPVVGVFVSGGATGIGCFDPSTSTWYLRSVALPGWADVGVFQYGGVGWDPVVGDWNGDGIDTIGCFDPSSAGWYLRDTNDYGAPDFAPFQYGDVGWEPVVGDWNGDGIDTIGVFDPFSAGWYLRDTNDYGAPDFAPFQYGDTGWEPVAGNYDFLAPLKAAGGALPGHAVPLRTAELHSIVQAALVLVADAGVDPAILGRLASARFTVEPLGKANLGLANAADNSVVINADAAGYGWFVDATPLRNEEFAAAGRESIARSGTPASGKMDLLSVVLHEMGHLAGRGDLTGHAMDLMSESLAASVRHTEALDQIFSGR